MFRNDGKGRFRDATTTWWPAESNVGEDDNIAAFLDVDSDGDADFIIGSLSGPDRLLINDGHGHLTVALVFDGKDTPGTLGLALADLDGDGRMDVAMGRAKIHRPPTSAYSGKGPRARHRTAIRHDGRSLDGCGQAARPCARARSKSPSLSTEWKRVEVEWTDAGGRHTMPMQWYGEFMWRAEMPAGFASTSYRVCATDAAGNTACGAQK